MKRRDFVALGAAIPAAASGLTLVSKTTGSDGQEITAEVGEIGVLRLRHGDLVVITSEHLISDEGRRWIHDNLMRLLPARVRCVVLDAGLQIGVIRADA